MRRLRLNTEGLVRLLPAAGVLVTWTVLMFQSGGFRPGTWLPAGLVLVGLLAVTIVGGREALPAARPVRAALLALAAFTAWCYLSLLWSDAPGATWEAANLLLLALLAAWILALTPWDARSVNRFLVLFSLTAAAASLAALLSALAATDLTSRFEDLRFSPPLDYPNSTAAFAFMAAIPALMLAIRPDASVAARACGQGLATFLGGFALLPQSRGSILGGVATLAILALTVPYRWRLTLHTALLLAALVAMAGPAGNVYTAAATTGRPSAALEDAAFAIGGVTLLAFALGGLLAALQRRLSVSADGRRTARRVGYGLTGLAVLAVLGLGAAKATAISDELSDQWRSLSHPGIKFAGTQANQDSGRLTSTDPLERYDYWRVEVRDFLRAPLTGSGAGSFEHEYTIRRRYPKFARYPHNLALKVLGETGLIGTGLLGAFLVLVAAGLLRYRGRRAREQAAAATTLAMLGYFAAHGSFDWLEAYPVLAGPALALPVGALAALAPGREMGAALAPAPPRRAGRAAGPATATVLVLAAVSLLLPWLGLRYRERAVATWRTSPAVAYRDLGRAADVEPLSPEPGVLRGVIGLSSDDLAGAMRGFDQAIDREDTWLPHFGLGVIAAARGDDAAARAQFAAARRLNRRDPVLPVVSARALKQDPVLPAQLIRDVLVSPFFEKERLR